MEANIALDRLGALAQETRLALFRRLIQQGPAGLAAGEIATALAVPAPTLSFHLAQLERAGLVTSQRAGGGHLGGIGKIAPGLEQGLVGIEHALGGDVEFFVRHGAK